MPIQTPSVLVILSGKSSSLKMKILVFTKTYTLDGIVYVKDQPVAVRDTVADTLIAAGAAVEAPTRTSFTDHCTNAATQGKCV